MAEIIKKEDLIMDLKVLIDTFIMEKNKNQDLKYIVYRLEEEMNQLENDQPADITNVVPIVDRNDFYACSKFYFQNLARRILKYNGELASKKLI